MDRNWREPQSRYCRIRKLRSHYAGKMCRFRPSGIYPFWELRFERRPDATRKHFHISTPKRICSITNFRPSLVISTDLPTAPQSPQRGSCNHRYATNAVWCRGLRNTWRPQTRLVRADRSPSIPWHGFGNLELGSEDL
jgi:hypothetical protein